MNAKTALASRISLMNSIELANFSHHLGYKNPQKVPVLLSKVKTIIDPNKIFYLHRIALGLNSGKKIGTSESKDRTELRKAVKMVKLGSDVSIIEQSIDQEEVKGKIIAELSKIKGFAPDSPRFTKAKQTATRQIVLQKKKFNSIKATPTKGILAQPSKLRAIPPEYLNLIAEIKKAYPGLSPQHKAEADFLLNSRPPEDLSEEELKTLFKICTGREAEFKKIKSFTHFKKQRRSLKDAHRFADLLERAQSKGIGTPMQKLVKSANKMQMIYTGFGWLPASMATLNTFRLTNKIKFEAHKKTIVNILRSYN